MRKTNWKSFELKKLGVHHKTARAILRLQRNQIYSDKKQRVLRLKIMEALMSINPDIIRTMMEPDSQ